MAVLPCFSDTADPSSTSALLSKHAVHAPSSPATLEGCADTEGRGRDGSSAPFPKVRKRVRRASLFC